MFNCNIFLSLKKTENEHDDFFLAKSYLIFYIFYEVSKYHRFYNMTRRILDLRKWDKKNIFFPKEVLIS